MEEWRSLFSIDPVPVLAGSALPALICRAEALLPGGETDRLRLWEMPEVGAILRRQQDNGAWKYPCRPAVRPGENYDILETFRNLGLLIEKYRLDRTHSAINRAAEYLFSHQTAEGDIRGIFGRQYAPHYTGGIVELLVKAGYGEDERVDRAFHWFAALRQRDGGWAMPLRTAGVAYAAAVERPEPVQPNRDKPFSHVLTGVILRAYAAHPVQSRSEEGKEAGELLLTRLFKPDRYPDRRGAEYWEAVSFPFWFTDIVSALDSLGHLGFTRADGRIGNALQWLLARQRPDGLFDLRYLRTGDRELPYWVCLAVATVVRRCCGDRT